MMVYDITITFSQEVEKVWKRRFSGLTILWFLVRPYHVYLISDGERGKGITWSFVKFLLHRIDGSFSSQRFQLYSVRPFFISPLFVIRFRDLSFALMGMHKFRFP